MSNTTFKFTTPADGFSRRVSFTSTPAWAELAGKLESLFGIRKESIGISYVDTDGDEIVISSDGELQEYLKSNADEQARTDAVEAMRFTVRELGKAPHLPKTATTMADGSAPSNIFHNALVVCARTPGTVSTTG